MDDNSIHEIIKKRTSEIKLKAMVEDCQMQEYPVARPQYAIQYQFPVIKNVVIPYAKTSCVTPCNANRTIKSCTTYTIPSLVDIHSGSEGGSNVRLAEEKKNGKQELEYNEYNWIKVLTLHFFSNQNDSAVQSPKQFGLLHATTTIEIRLMFALQSHNIMAYFCGLTAENWVVIVVIKTGRETTSERAEDSVENQR
ncbi:hypothetical protein DOY81_005278 [Sarcophaga bullata]|nr:hypothetical protein DOY81_005278 [Sarcophaga bullata]